MKRYDRELRKWIPVEEYERRQAKKKLCKGGKPHDWVKVLPSGVEHIEGVYKGDVEPYYEAVNEIEDAKAAILDRLEDEHGIREKHSRRLRIGHDIRHYACTVCNKKTWKI